MRPLLVTGSDTGVGKTWCTGELARVLAGARVPVEVVKVVETGAGAGPGDAATAAERAGGIPHRTLFRFAAALAPAAAARREGRTLSLAAVTAACAALPAGPGWRLFEGAGGIATPVDDLGSDWADVAHALAIDTVVIVVPDRLGAINLARLCAGRATAAGLRSCIWLNRRAEVAEAVAAATREALRAAGLAIFDPEAFARGEAAARSADLVAASTGDAAARSRHRGALAERERRHRRRRLAVSTPPEGVLRLADNDYFDLARDPALAAASAAAAVRDGTSASASPLLGGWKPAHEALIRKLAAWEGFGCGLLWSSGYAANAALLGSLPGPRDLVLADRLVHASMLAGLTRSGARFRRYPHLDLDRLEAELRAWRGGAEGSVFVATESVFSMDGDAPDLVRLAALRREHGFILIVDEAHGLGWYGPDGAGLVAEAGIAAEVDILIGTLGKTLGSGGAFTLFHEELWRDALINEAGEFIYSTGIPPPGAAAAEAAIDRVRALAAAGAGRAGRDQSRRFRAGLRADGWTVPDGDSPIVPLTLGDEASAVDAARHLEGEGILAAAVRPPTVPAGTSRLRFSLKRGFDQSAGDRVRAALRGWADLPA